MPPRQTSDSRRIHREDYFRHAPDDGSIRLSDGQRTAAVPAEFLHHLQDSLRRELGSSAERVLYACGYEWGLQEMVRLTLHLREEFGSGNLDLWQMDARFVLDSWWAPLTAAGWGTWTLDLTTQTKSITFVEVRNSAAIGADRPATAPMCHLYAGLFAGALSFYERGETHAVEIQCAAMGHPSCRFVVGPGAQIEAVEAWRHQGASADDVRRRIS
jgi:predicted hydrocarbon binding protein